MLDEATRRRDRSHLEERLAAQLQEAAQQHRGLAVLIAGAGPVGLSLAIELAYRGVRCLVVEQSDGSVDFPTTNLANTRTVEHLRRWGIADRMRYESGYPTDYPRNYLFVTRMDGYEIARRLRAEPWGAELKLVALTGWGQLGDRQRSQDAGFDQHLVKPVEPELLRRTLAELPEP